MHECTGTRWHRQSSGPAVNPAHRLSTLALKSRMRPVMEVQPDIQQRSGLDQATGPRTGLPSGHQDVCGLR
jgi:hypothetical protein